MAKYLLLLIAYLLGSIPFSFLLGKLFKGQDIRKLGSGNMGGTNSFRVFGKPIGFAVSILDVLKSGIVVFLVRWYPQLFEGLDVFHPLLYGLAAVLGHVYPLWFRFKGGKGVASSAGVLLAYQPILALALFIVFFVIEYATRYVSVASNVTLCVASLSAIVLHIFVAPDLWLVVISLILNLIVIIAHRANFQRLRNGTENRVKLFDKMDERRKKRLQP